ncbi:ComEC/Rec2 family competence protein [Xylanivirga thermophila]|uniref:ComEC/Rec2 family competence protein n=1 Tax=Xylanivirga thermophila TaxID=2496273 RepID=UPI00101CFEF2|nr:MBL fold metallo-hydrolase [Xylanivirga thermophila]
MKKISIPGFRNNSKGKKIAATIYYIWALLSCFSRGWGFSMVLLSAPFIILSFIDIIKLKKHHLPNKTAIISFFTAMAVFAFGTFLVYESFFQKGVTSNLPGIIGDTKAGEVDSIPDITTDQLKVHFLNVGQAESILIQQGQHAMLIDAGNLRSGRSIVEYMNKNGIYKLDYVIATHPHLDHIGGMPKVIQDMDIDKFIAPKVPHNSGTYKKVLTNLNRKGINVNKPIVGTSYALGDATFEVLAPNNDPYESLNDYSVVIKLNYKNTSFLFTGDAQWTSEQEMLKNGVNLNADVLKVGHHGSRTSTTTSFLKAVSPKYAVISAGRNNLFGHPTLYTVKKLLDYGVHVYRTDKSGTIVSVSDGEKIIFNAKAEPYRQNRVVKNIAVFSAKINRKFGQISRLYGWNNRWVIN